MARKMTEKEIEEFDLLYQYVRKNIMGYDDNQSLSRQMVLRLKGLSVNKFIENRNIKDTANYSYEVILNTFKFCSPTILKAFRNGGSMDEHHKFNLALKIVEKNINDVYKRMQNVKKAKEEIKEIAIDNSAHVGAEYQRKTKEVTNKLLDDLW